MKRLICLLLVLCLLLAGCGKKTAEVTDPTEASTQAPTTEATEPPTTEQTEPETEPESEPTEPSASVNPLTGEPLDDSYTGRPVAFTINNISACLPQYGLDDLDWMFEVETEGGITRCLGILTDPASADVLGPIRSCRTYFLNLSVSYNAPLFHCGGSKFANANQYSISDTVSSWDHVDQMTNGSKYFYRDSSRTGIYATEHTLFTTGERMMNAMADNGYDVTSGEAVDYGYLFSESVEPDGAAAETVSITFKGTKNTTMKYDAETGLYKAHQNGNNWIDGATGENATFRNLLVITTTQTKPENYHSFYELSGSGDGYFAVDGKMIPIKWHHDGVEGPFRFTLEDGTTPITLGIGSTYCAIIDVSGSVNAE